MTRIPPTWIIEESERRRREREWREQPRLELPVMPVPARPRDLDPMGGTVVVIEIG